MASVATRVQSGLLCQGNLSIARCAGSGRKVQEASPKSKRLSKVSRSRSMRSRRVQKQKKQISNVRLHSNQQDCKVDNTGRPRRRVAPRAAAAAVSSPCLQRGAHRWTRLQWRARVSATQVSEGKRRGAPWQTAASVSSAGGPRRRLDPRVCRREEFPGVVDALLGCVQLTVCDSQSSNKFVSSGAAPKSTRAPQVRPGGQDLFPSPWGFVEI
jgi:hypothetical protein